MSSNLLSNATEVDLSGLVPAEALTAFMRVTITPPNGGLLIYVGPDYEMPIVANGPVWEGHVDCQPPRIFIKPVGDPAPGWRIDYVGMDEELPIAVAS